MPGLTNTDSGVRRIEERGAEKYILSEWGGRWRLCDSYKQSLSLLHLVKQRNRVMNVWYFCARISQLSMVSKFMLIRYISFSLHFMWERWFFCFTAILNHSTLLYFRILSLRSFICVKKTCFLDSSRVFLAKKNYQGNWFININTKTTNFQYPPWLNGFFLHKRTKFHVNRYNNIKVFVCMVS